MWLRRAAMVAIIPMVVVQGSGCAETHCAKAAPCPGGCGPVQRNYAPAYPPPMVAAPLPPSASPPAAVPVVPPLSSGYQPPSYQPPAAAIGPQVTESRGGNAPVSAADTRPMPQPPKGARLQTPVVTAEPEPPAPKSPVESRPGATDFPPDIPQFNLVADQVAAGLQPFPEGFKWLKTHGYHTVLYLRAAGDDDAAIRTEVESNGMKYVTLEVSSQTLNRELVREFSRTVGDTQEHPLFVFDRKGMLAGSLWYLHFRLSESQADPQARARAVRLGLKEEAGGEYADLWLAINQVLRGM